MKELSLSTILEDSRQANAKRYTELEKLVNLRFPDRYDQLTSASLESYQGFRSAGFPAESLIDTLTEKDLLILAKAFKNDPSRLFVKDDLYSVIRRYALRGYLPNSYHGRRWEQMNEDIQTFQKQYVPERFQGLSTIGYFVVGLSPAMANFPVKPSRKPLLFYKIGDHIFFLVSSYDTWVPAARKALFWPFANNRNGLIAYSVYMTSLLALPFFYPESSPRWIGVVLMIFYSILLFGAMTIPLLRPRFYPDSFPRWWNRLMYKVLPY